MRYAMAVLVALIVSFSLPLCARADQQRDPELKEFARQTLPKIVDHLERAEKLAAAAGGRTASK